jgi:anti-anti-sigma factor
MVTWSDARIVLSGEIDELNADMVADRIRPCLTAAPAVLDLSGVTFFSAAGVRFLTKVGAAAHAVNGVVHVTCSPSVWRIMRVCDGTEMPGLMLDRAVRPGDGAPI